MWPWLTKIRRTSPSESPSLRNPASSASRPSLVPMPASKRAMPRRSDRGVERVGERLDRLEVPLGPAAAGDDDQSLGQLRARALHLVELDELRLRCGRTDGNLLHVSRGGALLCDLEFGGANGDH